MLDDRGFVISSYAIHHLDNDKKIEFILELKNLLNKDGKIVIGDVAFKTESDLIECKTKYISKWDEDEIYMTEDKIVPWLVKENIKVKYRQVSSCAGILEIY